MRSIRPIRTEGEYDAALAKIARYFENEPEPGTPRADAFDLLAMVIENYERQHWPIEPPDPVAAIEYRMEVSGYRQTDLAKLIGSRSREPMNQTLAFRSDADPRPVVPICRSFPREFS